MVDHTLASGFDANVSFGHETAAALESAPVRKASWPALVIFIGLAATAAWNGLLVWALAEVFLF